MAVFRVNKTTNYTVMSNHHLRNKNLSLKAIGMLSLILSLPEDWDYSVSGLCAITKDGKTAIQNVLKELEENGYLTRTRVNQENGRFDYIYDIYEQSSIAKPCHASPRTENPCTVNPPQINKDILSKEKLNKETNTSTNVLVGETPQYGNPEINEMMEKWEQMFGFKPKNTKADRFAVSNMLRSKTKGKDWLLKTMRLLQEAQKDRYAGKTINGISGFKELSYNYDKIWKWGSDKYQQQTAHGGLMRL